MVALKWVCLGCGAALEDSSEDRKRCPKEGDLYQRVEGIWRFLLPEREAQLDQFIREYEKVRRQEGRGNDDPEYYRALPFEDRSGLHPGEWRMRSAGFQLLVTRIVTPFQQKAGRSLRLLDLGAGNGWLSYRLSASGHEAVAVDLLVNRFDGLGAHIHYGSTFTAVQADFDRLPFASGQFDLALFNGSFHYSCRYEATVREALRVLRPDGELIALDTPFYRDAAAGVQMVREREEQFLATFGFRSNSLANENFLTPRRLKELAGEVGIQWQFLQPRYGPRWMLRRWRLRLSRGREAARFFVLRGKRCGSG